MWCKLILMSSNKPEFTAMLTDAVSRHHTVKGQRGFELMLTTVFDSDNANMLMVRCGHRLS